MGVAVKICGTTNLADALLAVEAGADAVGFVFAPSKRQVTAPQVRGITAEMPATVETVGVFTSSDADEILNAAIEAKLTTVQIHGRHAAGLVRAVQAGSGWKLRVLQVVEVPAVWSAVAKAELEADLREASESTANLLLDTSVKGTSGGTGVPFAWEEVARVLDRVPRAKWRLGLAGGLRPENVASAIAAIRPDFVDVVSGVEAAPGRKDPERLRAFFEQVRRA